jgi:hypothetical protein
MKVMNKIKILYLGVFAALVLLSTSCKKQLEVGNPNAPTVQGNVTSEAGLYSLAQGGVYLNGLRDGDGWLGNSYFSLPRGYHELMGDIVGGGEGSNNQTTTMPVPDYIQLNATTKLTNTSPQIGIIRQYNTRNATANSNNALYYEWLNMYALNSACNNVLDIVAGIPFTGDKASKANTVKAWAYWWKGWAYAQIGTLYYSGIIADKSGQTTNWYSPHDSIVARSNYYYNLAITTLGSVSSTADYNEVLGKLIPDYCQVGLGQVPTKDMWIRNINTMLARNILLNKLSTFVNGVPGATISKSSLTASMSAADWTAVQTLATNGIKQGDYVFTGRTETSNNFFTATGGTVAALATGKANNTTYKVSERFIQEFKAGDKRLASNFTTGINFNNNLSFSTRYSLSDGSSDPAVISYGGRQVGKYELIIAGSYEENAMMLAEAAINLGNISTGLGYIDAVRTYQGAGLAASSAATKAAALDLLTRERRVALAFRGLAFYDARRWGWIYSIANGGGRYGNTVVDVNGVPFTNATINYNFMDFWDVPADETDLNPAAAGSAAIKNPNY